MNNDTKISSMLATILGITPERVTFLRCGEDRPRSNFRLATATFPFDLLEVGKTYGIVSAFDGDYWSWKEAYEVGARVAEEPTGIAVVVFKKPRSA